MKTFSRDGVRFSYPANWRLDADDADGGWTVTVQSPQTAFAVVSLRPDAENAAQVADEVLAALTAEYKELDAVPALETVAGQPAVGHDLDFMTLDTSIVCWTRCLDTPAGPLLVMCQTSEFDREAHEPVLRAVCASLHLDE